MSSRVSLFTGAAFLCATAVTTRLHGARAMPWLRNCASGLVLNTGAPAITLAISLVLLRPHFV